MFTPEKPTGNMNTASEKRGSVLDCELDLW